MFCVKYPRTPHLPWSNPSKDDKIISTLDIISNEEIVVSEKMDGENTSLYHDYCHARSLEMLAGDDRGVVKAIWSSIAPQIPPGWRICGENLYATHSIAYDDLKSYFQVFSIWNDQNQCLDWNSTVEWCDLLGLAHVPVIYSGEWNEQLLRQLSQHYCTNSKEGYVVRVKRSFHYKEFPLCIAKMVRPNHVAVGSAHWRHKKIVANQLATITTNIQ